MRGYDYFYQQIASLASVDTRFTVAAVAQALAVVNTGRDGNFVFLSLCNKTGAITVRTFLFDDFSRSAAVRTCLDILNLSEEGLLRIHDLTFTVTFCTCLRLGSRFGSRAVTFVADFLEV